MKPKILFLFLLFYSGIVFCQNAKVQSFQHTARWISEGNFPNYISNKYSNDTILLVTADALKRKFNVKEVLLPSEISYKYYSVFGKPKLKTLDNSSVSRDFNVAILSFITRDTYNSKVYWNIEIAVQQNGGTPYSNKTVHELEYYTQDGYTSNFPWMNEEEFTKLFASLIEESLDSTKALPEKIIIGSQDKIQKEISLSIPNAEKLKMISSGNFLSNSNFSVSVEREGKVLTNVNYFDGKDYSKGKANFGGWLLSSAGVAVFGGTGSYMKTTSEKRQGKLEFTNGEIHTLQMEWEQNTENEVSNNELLSSRTGYAEVLSPMKINIIKNDSIYGNLTYFREGEIFVVEGMIQNRPINVSYAPSSGMIRIIENNATRVIVEMHNFNPENSGSFAGQSLSKNKMNYKKNTLPEWYNVYLEPNINETDTANYMEAVFCLFFGIGNHS